MRDGGSTAVANTQCTASPEQRNIQILSMSRSQFQSFILKNNRRQTALDPNQQWRNHVKASGVTNGGRGRSTHPGKLDVKTGPPLADTLMFIFLIVFSRLLFFTFFGVFSFSHLLTLLIYKQPMMTGLGLKRSLATQRLTKIGTYIDTQNITNRKHVRWWSNIKRVGALTKTNTPAYTGVRTNF